MKKAFDVIGKIAVVIGILMVIGTAGASDNGALDTTSALLRQIAISVSVIVTGAVCCLIARKVEE